MVPGKVLVASFDDHQLADTAVRRLLEVGFSHQNLSVVGKGFHSEEKVLGFLNTGDRMKIWGRYGAFWGGLWGALFGGVFLTLPLVGSVVVLGYLASIVVSMVEGAVVVGAISAVGAALVNVGIPQDHAIRYENAIKSDGFILLVHGSTETLNRAEHLLESMHIAKIEIHTSDAMAATEGELQAAETPLVQ